MFIPRTRSKLGLNLAENALGEFRIHSSVGKTLCLLLLGRNSGFQFSYSDLAGFEFGGPIPVDRRAVDFGMGFVAVALRALNRPAILHRI
jgi:hypothetical protein